MIYVHTPVHRTTSPSALRICRSFCFCVSLNIPRITYGSYSDYVKTNHLSQISHTVRRIIMASRFCGIASNPSIRVAVCELTVAMVEEHFDVDWRHRWVETEMRDSSATQERQRTVSNERDVANLSVDYQWMVELIVIKSVSDGDSCDVRTSVCVRVWLRLNEARRPNCKWRHCH